MNLLAGKRGLVFGVANHRSIAWHIAEALNRSGARLALTYQGERFEKNLRQLGEKLDNPLILPCDVNDDDQIKQVYSEISREFGQLDFIVHSIAFAQHEDLEGKFINTSREGFATAMNVSVYSLLAIVRPALPLMTNGGSVITLSYLGSQRAMPNYNVMGVAKAGLESTVRYLAWDAGEQNVRVNAISAGPINTVSARGISGFSNILHTVKERAPLRRNIDGTDVADTALFLVSDLSRGITGEVIYVDAGYNIMGI